MRKFNKSIQLLAIACILEIIAIFPTFNLSSIAQSQESSTGSQTDSQAESNQERSPHQHPPRPDLAAAAKKLGITEAKLVEALGLPPKPPESEQGRPPRPDLVAAAKKLGITEAKLVEALGLPPKPSQCDRAQSF